MPAARAAERRPDTHVRHLAAIRDDDLKRTAAVWDEPEYANVVLHRTLANAIEPWAD